MSELHSRHSLEHAADTTPSVADGIRQLVDAIGQAFSERLGVGGMGEVYRCGDDALQRDLAIKILKLDFRGDAAAEARFLREARLTGSLQHPGIVPVHQLGRLADGRPFYTMKLVRGRTVSDLLRDEPQGPERLPRLLAVLEKVCQAVAFAHSKGVIHRDLKPSNVMVGEFGEVQVMDWGLAKELSQGEPVAVNEATESVETVARTEEAEGLSRAGSALGTPAYMPPEQAAGDWDIVDERADVFALGAILCQVLTSLPPYHGTSRDELLRRARRGDVMEALARLEKCGADAALTELCRVCLAAERLQRPRHAGMVAERLAGYQAEVRERLRQAELQRARAEVKALEERKRRRLLAVLALAALVLLAGGVAVWQQWQQRRIAADRAVAVALGEAGTLRDQARADVLTAVGYEKTEAAARNAVEMARAGGTSRDMQRQAEEWLAEVKQEAEAAAKDRRLLSALLEVHSPREGPKHRSDAKNTMMEMAEPTVEEQLASAFREWGLDVDATPTAEAAARLKARPAAVVTEVIAALDEWASRGQRDGERQAALAAALDDDPGSMRRELRDIMARERLSRERALDVLSAALRPVPLPLEVPLGPDRTRLCQLAERIDPDSEPVLGLLTLTRALRLAGEEALAERRLRAAIQARPREVVLYHALGQLLSGQKPPRWAEAVECYAVARALRPDLGVTLATALRHSGHADEGLALLARMVRDSPDNPYLLSQQGLALEFQGKHMEAEKVLRKAIALNPDDARAYDNLGPVLYSQRRYGEAEAAFRKALGLKPDDAGTYHRLAASLHGQEKHVEAEAACRKALALKPDDKGAYTNLGSALHGQGKYVEAEAAYRKAIELKPDDALTYANLGVVLNAQRKLVEAEAACRKAIALQPDFAGGHLSLGAALNLQGKRAEAESAYRKGLALEPDDARAYTYFGLFLERQGKRAEAEAAYRKAIALKPDFAKGYHNLGGVLSDQGKYAEAEAVWRKTIALQPNDANAYLNLAVSLIDQGKFTEGLAAHRKVIALKPDDARAYYNFGFSLNQLGKTVESEAAYRKAIALKPDYAEAYNNLGKALERQRKPADAVAAYREAIVLKPDLAMAYHNLSECLCRQGKYVEAEEVCRKAITRQPDDSVAYHCLGRALIDQGKLVESEAAYRKAIALKPDYFQAHCNLGTALYGQGKPAEAEAAFRKALAIKPDSAEASFNLGNAQSAQRKHVESEAAYRKAIALKPDYAEAYNSLGKALARQGKPADAVVAFRKATVLRSDWAEAYNNLGQVLSDQGKLVDAEVAYRKAIALKPDHALAYYNLGIALISQGKTADAEASYRKAIALRPDYAEAHCNLGFVLQSRGQFTESLAVFRRGHELGSKRSSWRYPSLQWVRTAERFVDLENQLPHVLQGEAAPANAADAITLAWMCSQPYQKRYAASARLYADLFAVEPKLATDLQQQHRYKAACSAVLAAASQGEDARLLPDKVAVMFRRWALSWLRDDLTVYAALAGQHNAASNKEIRRRLAHWCIDANLASVRDPQALDRLADNERAAWQALWRDVDELAKRVAEKKP